MLPYLIGDTKSLELALDGFVGVVCDLLLRNVIFNVCSTAGGRSRFELFDTSVRATVNETIRTHSNEFRAQNGTNGHVALLNRSKDTADYTTKTQYLILL